MAQGQLSHPQHPSTSSIEDMLPPEACTNRAAGSTMETLEKIVQRRLAHSQPVFRMEKSLINTPPPAAAQEFLDGTRASLYSSWDIGPAGGLMNLREEIAHWRSQVYKERISSDNVVITSGATAAFALSMATLVRPGEHVMVLPPCFPNFYGAIHSRGAEAVKVPLYSENGFEPIFTQLCHHWTPQTRALALVNPNNPTGTVFSEEMMAALEGQCTKQGACMIVDETFAPFDLRPEYSPSHRLTLSRTICVGSFSETFSLADHRVGYLIGSPRIVEYVAGLQSCLSGGVSARDQEVALAALSQRDRHLSALLPALRNRDAQLTNVLERIDGIEEVHGHAGPYKWVKTARHNSRELAVDLAENSGVVVRPGADYGQDGWIRISFGMIGSSGEFNRALRALQTFDGWVRRSDDWAEDAVLPSTPRRRRTRLEQDTAH